MFANVHVPVSGFLIYKNIHVIGTMARSKRFFLFCGGHGSACALHVDNLASMKEGLDGV